MCPFQRGYTEEQIRLTDLSSIIQFVDVLRIEYISSEPYSSSLEYHPDYWLNSPSAEAVIHLTGVIPSCSPVFPTIYKCNKLNIDFFFFFFSVKRKYFGVG